jgi:hypothetical protein
MAPTLILFPTHDVVHGGGLKLFMALVVSLLNLFEFLGYKSKTRQLIHFDQSFVSRYRLADIMFLEKKNYVFTYSKFHFLSYKP